MYRLRGCIAAGTRLPINKLDLFPDMRFPSRCKFIPLTVAAVLIAGCSNSRLPDAPREVVFERQVELPERPENSTSVAVPDTTPALDTTPAEPVDIEIEVLHKADFNPRGADVGKSFRALQTPEVYANELARHSVETPKPIDFRSSQVLASSLGEKTTGGYAVSVTKITETDENMVVTVVQSIPGPGCITTQAASHPYEFVVIPSRKPIEIFERQQIDDC